MSKGRLWPFFAVQAMKSIRGCPMATCDPKPTFAQSASQMAAIPKAVIARWSEGFRM
jgi:hypothetical protein